LKTGEVFGIKTPKLLSMKEKPVDPETFITEESISWQTPNPAIEKRLDEYSGKHNFEVCLLQTYLLTETFFLKYPEIDEPVKQKHLYSIKEQILHYCIPSKIDWKKLLGRHADGHLIVKPNSKSDIYYKFLAYNLFLIEKRMVSRFLDFQLVQCVLKPFEGKPAQLREVKFEFFKRIDFLVLHMIDNNMGFHQKDISDEVCYWVRSHMDKFTEKDLIEYYEYEFDPNHKFGLNLNQINRQKPQYAGCDKVLLKAYFQLLSKPSSKKPKLFIPKNVVDYLLNRWFDVGNETEPPKDSFAISLEQMVFFFREFVVHFQVSSRKDVKSVNQKQLINFLYQDVPDLFGILESNTVYRKFKTYADDGYHEGLDWKQSKVLVSMRKEILAGQ
jgi:hypothetical protein